MSYSSFTAEKLKERFGVTQTIKTGLFSNVEAILPSKILKETIAYNVNFAILQGSEKARSEFIIAPILLEIKKKAEGKVSLFSGVKFDVDKNNKLDGICDFLISRSSYQAVLEAPVVVAVEAKRQDFEKGIAQCAAEMIASLIFNERKGTKVKVIYGCVTTGDVWRFLMLKENKIYVDSVAFDVNEDLGRILGILFAMSLDLIKT
ncbi:MAG: hypothetical protein MUC29_01545 [Pyrinomonadaceae bacterium]|jgi:hypothetical protein|nr:hypothetical protein [Pyrinomonadaceae bacterium]